MKKLSFFSRLRSSIFLVMATILASSIAQYASANLVTWRGYGSSQNINDGNNWWGGSSPSPGDDLQFNNTGSGSDCGATGDKRAYDNYASSYFGNMIAYSCSGGMEWAGNQTAIYKFENQDTVSFTATANLQNRTGPDYDLQINPVYGPITVYNVIIYNNKWLYIYGGNTLNVNGVISQSSGTSSLVCGANNSSTVILNAVNTFSGTTYVLNGTLRATTSGALEYSAVTLGDTSGSAGAAVNLDGGSTWNGQPITVRSGSSGTLTIANTSGTSGTATYNDNIILNQAVTFYANSSGSLSFSGTTLDMQSNTLIVDGGGNTTISGTLANSTGSGALTKNGSGTLTLSGANTYTGGTTISAGNLTVSSGGNLGSGSIVSIASGASLTVNNSCSVAELHEAGSGNGGTASIGSGAVLTVNGSSLSTFYMNSISGLGGLTMAGSGSQMQLYGSPTYSGNTTISAGTLGLQSGVSLPNSSVIIAAGGTFDVSAISSYTWGSSAGLTASGTGTSVGTSAATINGGTTVSLGSRPITLTYDGSHPALYISQGTLSLSGNAFTVNKSSALSSGTYTIVQQASGNITSSGSYTVTGTAIDSTHYGTISVSGGNVILTVALKPTVSGKSYSRAPGTAIKIFASDLAATATVDASLSYTAAFDHCDSTTANSASLGINGSGNSAVIVYPGSAGNSADSFSYTINDGHGGSASGTVSISISPSTTGQKASITVNGGVATIEFFGVPGYHYAIQRSADGLSNWTDITVTSSDAANVDNTSGHSVITAPSAGAFTVVDSSPPGGSAFYQLLAAP